MTWHLGAHFAYGLLDFWTRPGKLEASCHEPDHTPSALSGKIGINDYKIRHKIPALNFSKRVAYVAEYLLGFWTQFLLGFWTAGKREHPVASRPTPPPVLPRRACGTLGAETSPLNGPIPTLRPGLLSCAVDDMPFAPDG